MKRLGWTTVQVVAAAAGIVVLGASLWGFVGRTGSTDDKAALPQELSVEALAQQAKEDPGAMRRTFRETVEREDLTEEQQRQARRNMRRVWGERLNENVDSFFNASEDEKQVVLDRHIDEFQKRREEWAQRREARRREREANGESDDGAESSRERYRRRARSTTREDRKNRSESRDPDQSARRMVYFNALRKRMQERGIEMPGRFGGGNRGGNRNRGS